MATKSCSDCGGKVSESAASCPHCGKPQKSRTSGCAWAFLVGGIGAIIIMVMQMASNPLPSSMKDSDTPESRAYYAARRLAEGTLKSPSTAKWSNYHSGDTGAELVGGGVYKAWGTVDAENSFGAKLRQNWTAYVSMQSNGIWTLHYCKMGDTEIGSIK